MTQSDKKFLDELTGDLYSEKEKAQLREVITMQEYLERLLEDPRPSRTAHQRAYDFITAAGVEEFEHFKEKMVRYNFFRDLDAEGNAGKDSIFGIEKALMSFVTLLKSAAYQYGTEKRIMLLHGPVGSSKSTIAKLLKRGFEADSYVNPIYSIQWKNLGDIDDFIQKGEGFEVRYGGRNIKLFDFECQMHEDPVKLLEPRIRDDFVREVNRRVFGDDTRDAREAGDAMRYRLNPDWDTCIQCNMTYNALMEHYNWDWRVVMENHVSVKRLLLSEQGRVGIGTFIPADEKNQDTSDLTGNIDFYLLPYIGSDADPRAFNLLGELCRGNRGVVEMIEMLKLERAFLYPLLEASQDRRIKPKNFAKIPVDEIILGHTNHEEFERLQDDDMQKALRDRTERIDVPYNLELRKEVLIYARDYHNGEVDKRSGLNGTNLWKARDPSVDKHIAPLTLEIPSLWAVLTRLEEPPMIEGSKDKVSLIQKLYLYDGKRVPKFGEDKVKELKEAAEAGGIEGFEGISPRFIQDCLGYSISSERDLRCVNPFMVLSAIRSKLKTSTLIASEEDRDRYAGLLKEAEEELYRRTTEHVQISISADEGELKELANRYVKECNAYTTKEKIRDRWSSKDRIADEKFLRRIEDRIGVSESQKDEFRGKIMQYIGSLHLRNQEFDFKQDADLYRALRIDLYESKKDKVELSSIFKQTLTPEEQEKIDVVRKRLKDEFGYCDVCATDALNYVGAEIARGHEVDLFI